MSLVMIFKLSLFFNFLFIGVVGLVPKLYLKIFIVNDDSNLKPFVYIKILGY